ncbi:ComF family protein [Nodosilinea sp. LEGE 07088]|uniref:ComF family protein n=1 Tax=Nodosilinea sp. LEGE 07088 TaxID=2777968 RepID=UPI001880364F|nr:ComF family protein [Nodosilinea sp. LEGE 07088]MBE9136624.1 ComF family protein [Nodosilinea sp. LEGE 07088]
MQRLLSTALIHRGQQQLLNLFLSGQCPLCQRSTPRLLCPSCDRQVQQCQSTTAIDLSQPGLAVVSWGHYENGLRQAIGRLKYSGNTDIAQYLGTELGQTWLDQRRRLRPSSRPIAIVPIPLHPTKLQQRGFNQADLLARWFCRLTQLPLYRYGLARVQATQAQHSLGRTARQQNLAQAFAVDPDQVKALQHKTVWLLDDIFTTGATAQSAAQTLRRSGLSVGGICTVARAQAWATVSGQPAQPGSHP